MREIALLIALAVGLALIVTGVSLWSLSVAFIVAGVGVIGIALLCALEVG